MLIGTTYAWFTDEVTSGVNKIVAGNLDVELYRGLDRNATPVDINTELFKLSEDQKWEPGAVVYENLTVANLGNLALKYQLSVNVGAATQTTDGKTLADVLKIAVVEDGITTQTREDLKALTTYQDFKTFTREGELIPNSADDVYGLVIYWEPTANDNLYNMNNEETTELDIEIGVKLYATQAPYEEDSFDNMYDDPAWVLKNADAVVENATELAAALAEGGLVALANDIDGDLDLSGVADDTIFNFAGSTVNGTLSVAEGEKITINGQGGVANDDAPALEIGKNADVTLSGGTFTTESGAAVKLSNRTEESAKLTIEEGTAITAPTLISLDVIGDGYAGAEIEINGGDFTATSSSTWVRPINVGGADVTINGGNFEAINAGDYCYFIDVSDTYNTQTGKREVGDVTINGGYFKSDANYCRVVNSSSTSGTPGTVTINGGTFEMLGDFGVLADIAAHVVVNDCTFVGGGRNVFGTGNNNNTDRTIEVNGGNYTITPTMSTWSIPLGSFAGSYPTDTSPVGKVILKGGTINSYICDGSVIGGSTSVDLVADGYHVVANSDGTNSVVAD